MLKKGFFNTAINHDCGTSNASVGEAETLNNLCWRQFYSIKLNIKLKIQRFSQKLYFVDFFGSGPGPLLVMRLHAEVLEAFL